MPIAVSFKTLSGKPPTAYVAMVETSTSAATINRLAWIRIPAIKVVLMMPRGDF